MAGACLYVIGDEQALGEGVGEGFVQLATRHLEPQGFILNMESVRRDETVMALVQEEQVFLEKLLIASRDYERLIVVMALGINDRKLFGWCEEASAELEKNLRTLLMMIQHMDPILVEMFPDGTEARVARDLGLKFCPLPLEGVSFSPDADGNLFLPQAVHQEIASSLVSLVFEDTSEPQPPAGRSRAGASDMQDVWMAEDAPPDHGGGVGDFSDGRRLQRQNATGGSTKFDGAWEFGDRPGSATIENGIIKLHDSHQYLQLHLESDTQAFVEDPMEGRIGCQYVNGEIHWSDGDVWNRLKDDDVPQLAAPPMNRRRGNAKESSKEPAGPPPPTTSTSRTSVGSNKESARLSGGDLEKLFKEAWKALEEAHRFSVEELSRNELNEERDIIEQLKHKLHADQHRRDATLAQVEKDTEVVAMLEAQRQAEAGSRFPFCW
mmetsp:Transcript_74946/g.156253  ORF Transcript_74946/g.156253 Transcript_74946/m.156253 type:complete len:437 (-) Transcript_74946:188-1498(-)|eukprot:CAMPEP_0206435192 /NCGR_PEP_ID=MMETSP0324_2-20121206/9681_1 /ASSEMBLY_ACC=CAM_ASM_000836 /TAXON_ID=2866 /ORGANISM="Crypthecodinium cohnii, Strain Seligo" /LENGTH=436 /DNA_ID=CAMNT_0053901999 /DNA_START=118 /DNA_END=1428 /DNA_ORIENTATION=-